MDGFEQVEKRNEGIRELERERDNIIAELMAANNWSYREFEASFIAWKRTQ